jgi:hypothetical protein
MILNTTMFRRSLIKTNDITYNQSMFRRSLKRMILNTTMFRRSLKTLS